MTSKDNPMVLLAADRLIEILSDAEGLDGYADVPQAFGISWRIIATIDDLASNDAATWDLAAVTGWEATVTMASAMDLVMRRHIERLPRGDDTQAIEAHIAESRRILAAFESDRQKIVVQLRRFMEQPGPA